MKAYIIKDANGAVVNTIIASEEFVKANYTHYEEYIEPVNVAQAAREWRDSELEATDKAAQTPDWPNRDAILVYRQTLRDWPSTEDFPDTRPELGV